MTISAKSQASTQTNATMPIIQTFDFKELPGLVASDIDLSKLHQLNPQSYPFLLESVAKGALGEFDILFAYPQETLQLESFDQAQNFIERAQQQFEMQIDETMVNESNLPFIGGWFAYFSYDYAQVVEPVLNLPKPKFPLANLTRVPAAIIIEHATGIVSLVAEPKFQDCLPQMQADLVAAKALEFDELTVRVTASKEEREPR